MVCDECCDLDFPSCDPWSPRADRIEKAAGDGCRGCSVISNGFRALSATNTSSTWEQDVGLDATVWESSWERRTEKCQGPFELASNGWQHIPTATRGPSSISFFIPEGLRVSQEWPNIGSAGIVPPNTGSEASINQLRTWLAQCREQHPGCDAEGRRLPRRVVDIGGISDPEHAIRLHEPQGEEGDYICLSYRWPETPSARLLRSNIQEYKAAIPFHEVSLTFRQMFIVVRALGVRYVWIDALCIVQDDDDDVDDKARDIASMDSIYESSILTIMSAWSTDELFSSLDEHYHHKEVQLAAQNESSQRVFVRHALPHYFQHDKKSKPLPFFSRAWIFQERVLSRRIVYFTQHELVWDCWAHRRCQCSAFPWDAQRGLGTGLEELENLRELSRLQDSDDPSHTRRRASAIWWKNYVYTYTGLKMSNPTDRLKAIAGLAARVQVRGGKGAYLAGLWEDSLVQDLCWQTFESDGLPVGVARPEPWRAPTWSWASIDSRITNGVYMAKEAARVTIYAEIVRTDTIPDSPRPSDILRRGIISIRTAVTDIVLGEVTREDREWRRGFTFQWEDLSGSEAEKFRFRPREGRFTLDCTGRVGFLSGVRDQTNDAEGDGCLLKMLYDRNTGDDIWLVAQKVPGGQNDLYERIGLFSDYRGRFEYGREKVVRLQ